MAKTKILSKITGLNMQNIIEKERKRYISKKNTEKSDDPQFILESLSSCSHYLDFAIKNIKSLSTHLQGKNNNEMVAQSVRSSLELIDLHLQLISNIIRLFPYQSRIQETIEIKNLQIHLLSLIKSISNAKSKNDIIMLSDLIEYELIDNLTRWKINVIPSLINIVNSSMPK